MTEDMPDTDIEADSEDTPGPKPHGPPDTEPAPDVPPNLAPAVDASTLAAPAGTTPAR